MVPVVRLDADALWQALDALPAPEVGGPAGPTRVELWVAGGQPEAMPDDPDAVSGLIHRLLPG